MFGEKKFLILYYNIIRFVCNYSTLIVQRTGTLSDTTEGRIVQAPPTNGIVWTTDMMGW